MTDTDPYGRLFELSRDAVTEIEIVDQLPIVRAVNPAFVDVFGYDEGTIVGESLNDFIVPEHHSGEASTFDQRTADGEVNWATVSRQTADGLREFLYRSVPFERDGEPRALAIYTDITDQRRRKRHHQVLHRVLRHNLRNDLTQILAASDALLNEADEEDVRAQAKRIRAAVDDLEELSSAASKVEDLLGADRVEYGSIDLADVLDRLVARYRSEFPAATIGTDVPDALNVTADHRLDAALDALIENAVEHSSTNSRSHARENTVEHSSASSRAQPDDAVEHGNSPQQNGTGASDGPRVHIAVETAGSEAIATIVDDGPGIPEYERAAVFDERPLSQLSHGSGLGLWLAKWVIESYGGRLTYERRGNETIVAAHVPLAAKTHPSPPSHPQD